MSFTFEVEVMNINFPSLAVLSMILLLPDSGKTLSIKLYR